MNRLLTAALVAILLVAAPSAAELTIEELVSQARLQEGSLAVREVPRWKGARKILVLGDEDVRKMQALFPDIEFVFATSAADAMLMAEDVDAIIGSCDAPLIAAAEKLVWAQIRWAGAERCLSVPRVASGDVMLTNMQKMSAPVIGEHAVAMAMSLARGLPFFARRMESGLHPERFSAPTAMMPLFGKTMLVVGLGGIGSEAARRGAALGMRVLGTRNSSREGPDFVDYVGLSDELFELAGRADVIVNALPLTEKTRGLLDENFFAAAKKGALLVNVGRGATVDTDALVAALTSGQIGGAGLDVTEPEPLPDDHPLWGFDNVIITPHVAGRGGERERHSLLILENLRRYAAGERLLNVVDPEKGY